MGQTTQPQPTVTTQTSRFGFGQPITTQPQPMTGFGSGGWGNTQTTRQPYSGYRLGTNSGNFGFNSGQTTTQPNIATIWNTTQPTSTQPTGIPVTNVTTGQAGGSGTGGNPPPPPPGLDPNVQALIAALGGINWGAAGTHPTPERELSLVRPTEFSGRETEDPNDCLERYNRIADANK